MAQYDGGYEGYNGGAYRLRVILTLNWQDTASNSSNVNIKLQMVRVGNVGYYNRNSTPYSISIGGQTISGGSSYDLRVSSGNTVATFVNTDRTFVHNADGTLRLSFSASHNAGQGSPLSTGSVSGYLDLPTIARASKPTLSSGTTQIGNSVTIYTNRSSGYFTHTIEYAFGGASGTIATGVGDSVSWTIPLTLANRIPNSTSGSGVILCKTYSGGSHIGTQSVSFVTTIPNNATFQPTASITSIAEAISDIATQFNAYVQNRSKFNVKSSGSGKYGASITQYRVNVLNQNYYGNNVTTNVITSSGNVTILLEVTDSRGFKKSISTTRSVVAYFVPRINEFTAGRVDNKTNLTAKINFEIAPVGNKNTKQYILRYRQVGTTTWTNIVSSTAYYSRDYTQTASNILNIARAYEVQLYVADYFTSVDIIFTISSAKRAINIHPSGDGVAFGKFSERQGYIELGLTTVDKDGTVVIALGGTIVNY